MKLMSVIKAVKPALAFRAEIDRRYLRTCSILKNKSYFAGRTDRPLKRLTYGEVFDQATEKTPDRTYIHSHQQKISKTYSEVKQDADDIAAGLLSLGLSKGDTVAILSESNYETAMIQVAAAKACLKLAVMSPTSTAPELEYLINKVHAKALIYNDKFKGRDSYETLKQVIPDFTDSKPGQLQSDKAPMLETLIQISNEPKPGTYILKDIFDAGQGSDAKRELERRKHLFDTDDAAMILFTSGTTGKPKAVELSHHNTINNAMLMGYNTDLARPNQTICSPVPFFHCFGCVGTTTLSTIFNQTIVIPSEWFNPKVVLEAIEKYSCTLLYGTPTMQLDVINEYQRGQYDVSSLKSAFSGGATCQPNLMETMRDVLKLDSTYIGYGTTEASPLITTSDTKELGKLPQSVGKIQDHTEVKLVDSHGIVVPIGDAGELLVRGYLIMLGYYNDEEATKKAVTKSRWYKTGDLGRFTEDGNLSVIGRIKDMIIRGGENVYPAEIEHFLLKHPDIIDVQVFGVEDERLGEEVCAWILPKPDSNLTSETIRNYCKNQISSFKIPKHIKFVKEYPKTPSGKIQKHRMAEIMKIELA